MRAADLLRFTFPTVLALFLTACGGGDSTGPGTDNPDPDPPTSPDPVPAAVAVSPAADSLGVDDSVQLQATVTDSNGNELTGETVTWSSSNNTVATVSNSGEVTGVSDGSVDITATVGSLSGSADVSVFAGLEEVTDAGGTVEAGGGASAGGATLDVPGGALTAGTTITVAPIDAAAVAVGAIPGTAWEFGPEGLTFGSPATLTLSYEPASLPAGADASRLVIVRSDGSTIERLDGVSVDEASSTVQASVPGFSSFAICLPSVSALCGAEAVTDISATMVASRESVQVGDTLTYTLAITNEGPDNLSGGSIALVANGPVDYPTDFVTPQGCSLGSGDNGIGFSCGTGALSVGSSATFELRALATAAGQIAATGGPFQLPSSVDPDASNDTAKVFTPVAQPSVDLAYSLVRTPQDLQGGQPASFTFGVTNPSPTYDAENVWFTMSIFGDVSAASSWTLPDGCELGTTVEGGADIGVLCRPVTVPAGQTVSEVLTVDIGEAETELRVLGSIVQTGSVSDPDESNNAYDQFIPVTPAPLSADLVYDYSVTPTSLDGGSTATFEFSVTNPADRDAENVRFELNLFGDVIFTEGWRPTQCQGNGPGFNGAAVTVFCDPVSVPANGSLTEIVEVDIGAAETAIQVVGSIVRTGTAEDPDLTNNAVDETLAVTPVPTDTDLVIEYVLDPVSPVAGSPVTATITVSNLGTVNAADVVWAMNFNNGVAVAGGYTPPSGCVLGSPADQTIDGTGLRCVGVPVPAGGSSSATLEFSLADTATVIDIVGSITDFGTVTDTNAANNSVSDQVTVEPAPADPLIVLNPDSVYFVGGPSETLPSQIVQIVNGGGGELLGLDTDITYTDGSGWLAISLGLQNGEPIVFLQADPSNLGTGTYRADVSVLDPQAANSPQGLPVVLEVLPQADFQIGLANAPASAEVGDTLNYEVTLTNGGPATADSAIFVLAVDGTLLSPGFEFTPPGCGLFTNTPEQDPLKLYRCAVAGLPVGADATFTLPLIPQVAGEQLRARAVIDEVVGAVDPDLSNDTVEATTDVTASTTTDLRISAEPSTALVAGESATIAFGVGNLGGVTANGVTSTLAILGEVTANAQWTVPAGCRIEADPLGISADFSLVCGPETVLARDGTGRDVTVDLAGTATELRVVAEITSTGDITDPDLTNNTIDETAPVSAAPDPGLIVLTPDSLSFDAVEGGAQPNPRLVQISNGGGGTLTGLDAGVSYDDGSSGWLNAFIAVNNGEPVVVTQADQTGLAQGTYTATVSVTSTSADNSPQTFPVVLNVLPAADIRMEVANAPASVNVGTTIDYQVTINNDGPAAASEVTFQFFVSGTLLSPGLEFTPEGCGLFTSPEGADPAKLYQCTVTGLASGASQTFTLPLIPQVSGETLEAATTVPDLQGASDPNPLNDVATATTTVN